MVFRCLGDLGMTGAGVGIQGSKVRSQKRASRAGIQPTKRIGPLESTDRKMDGTIADLKPDSLPKLHDQGVTTPGGNMNRAPFEFILLC
ncbi:MAG: hypothetical protein DMG23_08520 [Acidobacteria bacterium]|nr:MAG: hypothetical protein DMG23_08520 [Acidobacteriota bacterium]